MTVIQFPKLNNLEWLRLIFAWQVVLVHAGEHLKSPMPDFIHHFPGVPAFFFVSGFLIYASYLNAPGRIYYENRFLRLIPALVAVTMGGAAVALMARGLLDLKENFSQYIMWFLAQISLGQAYNPSLFRDIGVGVINGSLWSITVEILFYFSVPLVVFFEQRVKRTVLWLMLLSFAIYMLGPDLLALKVYREKSIYDVLGLTPIVWGWMFGFGILCAKHFKTIQQYLQYAPWLTVPLAAMMAFGEGPIFGSTGNSVGIAYFICYTGLILWMAFCAPYTRLPFDISYGTYIWHMPVINFMLLKSMTGIIPSIVGTAILATASWYLIERPALGLKKKSLHRL
jgi:peptidoglycan/LPS O-acetylase OafA/YrhL